MMVDGSPTTCFSDHINAMTDDERTDNGAI
jgi:hypothetical protein